MAKPKTAICKITGNCTYFINHQRSQNKVLYSYHKEEDKSSNPTIILKLPQKLGLGQTSQLSHWELSTANYIWTNAKVMFYAWLVDSGD